jgi:hypothetical protein
MITSAKIDNETIEITITEERKERYSKEDLINQKAAYENAINDINKKLELLK